MAMCPLKTPRNPCKDEGWGSKPGEAGSLLRILYFPSQAFQHTGEMLSLANRVSCDLRSSDTVWSSHPWTVACHLGIRHPTPAQKCHQEARRRISSTCHPYAQSSKNKEQPTQWPQAREQSKNLSRATSEHVLTGVAVTQCTRPSGAGIPRAGSRGKQNDRQVCSTVVHMQSQRKEVHICHVSELKVV